MKEEIKTHFIFLDTSVFIQENFFAGNKLKAFLKHEKESDIELVSMDITFRELQSNLAEYFRKAHNELGNALKGLNNKAKIFKNLTSLNSVYRIEDEVDFDSELKTLQERLEIQHNSHFRTIDLNSDSLPKIIDDYFFLNPPFKEGKKKFEFPDAFVLNSLEEWCIANGEKMYVVSNDSDMLSYKSDHLLMIKEYDKLLELISFTYSEKNISSKIDELIEHNKDTILMKVESAFAEEFPTNGWDDTYGYEYEVHGIEELVSEIDDYHVLSVYDNLANVELSIPVAYKVHITYEDTSMAIFDKEDDRYYFEEYVDDKIAGDDLLKVIIEIQVPLPGKIVTEFDNFEPIEINGIPDNIRIY